MTADHGSLLKQMGELEAVMKELVRVRDGGSAPNASTAKEMTSLREAKRDALAGRVQGLMEDMLPHLDEEERVLIPILETRFTPAEYVSLATDEILPRVQKYASFELPWMLDEQEP